ncbi:MAG TPA: hypothetical protein VHM91_03460 [Verrucomicrobiales bacterium]|nr:hypothetical protein [Verrucomicrobiales bacterium]
MRRRFFIPVVVTAFAGPFVAVPSASAGPIIFTNGGSGPWGAAENWDLLRLPANGDTAQVNNGGTVVIDSATSATATGITLGTPASSSGNLQITGGALTLNSDLRIGGGGSNGTGITTMSGGVVSISPANLNLGFGPAASSTAAGTFNLSDGTVTVVNASSIIAVGNRGTGTVNQTGGTVYARSTGATPSLLNLGRSSSAPNAASGTYNLSGGSVTVATLTYGNVVFAGGTNTFTLSGTGSLTAGTISVTNTGATNVFNFTGGTLAASAINIPLTNTGGTLKTGGFNFAAATPDAVPNDPTGTLIFGTNVTYTQTSGATLAIDIDGPGSNDVYSLGEGASAGNAFLGGTIAVNLIGGYDPAPGTSFDVVMADTITISALVTGTTPGGNIFEPSIVTGGDGRAVLKLTVRLDADHDLMSDEWEAAHGLNTTLNDSALDADTDGLTNLQEYRRRTDPQDSDTDNDGLADGVETATGIWVSVTDTGTNPFLPDTDADGLMDGVETHTGVWVSPSNTGTNPVVVDSDGDGLIDGIENPSLAYTGPAQPGTNPNLADTDADTFSDSAEVNWPSNPLEPAEFPNPGAGSTLAIDFEAATTALQPGFTAMGPSSGTGTQWTGTFGTVGVTIVPTGACTLDTRDRAAAGGGGIFNPLFRDFLFGNANTSTAAEDGLDVKITGLAPLTSYPVTIWSWDPTSAPTVRSARWSATDGAAGQAVKADYTMSTTVPVLISDQRLQFSAITDATGTLLLQGRRNPDVTTTATHSVFLNGLVIGSPATTTPLRFTSFGPLAGGNFPLTWASEDSGVYKVETSPDLVTWQTLAATVDGQPGTTTYTDSGILPSVLRRFYRVSRVSP